MERKPAVYPAKNMPICRYLAGATGLEPATSGVTGRRSNQLNYAPGRRSSVAVRRTSATMTTLDWVLVGFAAFAAIGGYRRGLVGSVLALAGL